MKSDQLFMTNNVIVYEKDIAYLITFRLEGIYSRKIRLQGYEMLSEVTDIRIGQRMDPHLFFAFLNEDNIARILKRQLKLVDEMAEYFRALNMTVSININNAALHLLINDNSLVIDVVRLRDIVRFEIDEDIQIHGNETVLMAVRELCPIWLDDFGRGDFIQQQKYVKYFEYIKIDRNFIHSIIPFSSGKKFLIEIVSDLHCEGPRVVAEGVENMTILQNLHIAGFDGFQGWLWKDECITENKFCEFRIPS